MKPFQTLRKVVDTILEVAIVALFLTMFGVTTLNVIMRYIFNSPINFSVELGRYTFVAIVYLGAIFVMREDGHIGLDVIVDALPGKLRIIVKKFARVLVLGYLVLFCYESTRMVMTNWTNRSSTMRIPMSIVYMFMVIGSLGMFIEEAVLLFSPEKSTDQEESESPEEAEELGGGM